MKRVVMCIVIVTSVCLVGCVAEEVDKLVYGKVPEVVPPAMWSDVVEDHGYKAWPGSGRPPPWNQIHK
jgi:hypothetical protein